MQAGASIPIYLWRQMRHGHGTYLVKQSSYHFLKKFSRSLDCVLSSTYKCNMFYQTHLYAIYIFFIFFGVIIPNCQLPKFTENAHKIAQNGDKMSKNCLRGWGGWVGVRHGGKGALKSQVLENASTENASTENASTSSQGWKTQVRKT